MAKLICFNLGNFWKFLKSNNRAELIQYIEKLKVDGIEIGLSKREDLFGLSFNKEQKKYLKELKYVSIHLPVGAVKDCFDKEVIKSMDKVIGLYNEINAQCIVIHPDALPSAEIFEKYKDKARWLTENLDKFSGYGIKELMVVFEKYPYLGLCLDVCHCLTWGSDNANELVREFGDRIFQIHMSNFDGEKQHTQVKGASGEFLKHLESIRKFNVPIVIEEDFDTDEIEKIQEEIDYIRGIV